MGVEVAAVVVQCRLKIAVRTKLCRGSGEVCSTSQISGRHKDTSRRSTPSEQDNEKLGNRPYTLNLSAKSPVRSLSLLACFADPVPRIDKHASPPMRTPFAPAVYCLVSPPSRRQHVQPHEQPAVSPVLASPILPLFKSTLCLCLYYDYHPLQHPPPPPLPRRRRHASPRRYHLPRLFSLPLLDTQSDDL